MENITETKQLIADAKNICLIPSEAPEAVSSAMALFYTLKELGKNVNLVIDAFPENLKFLAPSLDFISYPKNFVISVPNSVANISQIYYEKGADALKIHLTLENGNIKKDNIAFYFSEAKPDLIITFGVKDYAKELSGRLNSFGFLLDSPVLNIDTSPENKKFGKINLLGDSSLAETSFNLLKDLGEGVLKKEPATCLLAGLVCHTGNFKDKVTSGIFQMASDLMKNGADLKEITNNLKI
jgi:nanoRNase/pAp phosphatase (c-di-AMP/oligoRNAs hydrolase)